MISKVIIRIDPLLVTISGIVIWFVEEIKFKTNIVIINPVNRGKIDAKTFLIILPLSIKNANTNKPKKYKMLAMLSNIVM